MSNLLTEQIAAADRIAIGGHIRPDGDCIGSCMALYLYLRKNFPSKHVHVYAEPIAKNLSVLHSIECIDREFLIEEAPFDLFVVLDCSSPDRLGKAQPIMEKARNVLVIDHHITNTHFGDVEVIHSDASSTCEVLYSLMEPENIDLPIAEALYLGIIHDTGVFKYSSTSEHTMQVAGHLMSLGIDTASMIDNTFYKKTYLQNRVLGHVLFHSELTLDGKLLIGTLSAEEMEQFHACAGDTDGIIDQLRITEGVEVAIFAREDAPNVYKLSLRSNGKVDVASIAIGFDGGGHRFAAGCTVNGPLSDVLLQISALIMLQL